MLSNVLSIPAGTYNTQNVSNMLRDAHVYLPEAECLRP
jgi:hypothetical protein